MSVEESQNELVLKLEKMDPKENLKDLLLQYDCASKQWQQALTFAVINDRTTLLDEMIDCMEEKNFSRNENCAALFDAVWYFKNESAKRLISYSDVYMGAVASVEIKNTDAFDFLIDLLTHKEKTDLLNCAIFCENVDTVEKLLPQCDYQKILDREKPSQKSRMRACNAAWRRMEELIPTVELKKTLTAALHLNSSISNTVVARKI